MEKKKILYVEDNLANRMLIRQVLTDAGYEVLEAEDGMAGIQMARQYTPDLILMDINIPGMDGYEAATKIKSIEGMENTPIIALTARVMIGDRERALTAGCDGYFSKPIDIDSLPNQIGEFLSGRREKLEGDEERLYLREYSERLVARLEEKIAELSGAYEELQRADSLKSQFISIAAHELRTPLTVIRGYLDILLSPDGNFMKKTDAQSREMVQGISQGVDRLYGIVGDILDITRIDGGTLQLQIAPVNPGDTIRKVVAKYNDDFKERKQHITVEGERSLPTIWGDGKRLHQLLSNLLSNAIKYTPDGGNISIKGRPLSKEDLRYIPYMTDPEEEYIEITVSDTGVGVDSAEKERIFSSFYEAKDPQLHSTGKTRFMGGGIGLGLAISRGIARAHDGWLWVESEGHNPETLPGSIFHLVLPVGTNSVVKKR